MGGGDVESTVLIAVGPDRVPHVAADGVMFPNGMAITGDGSTLIVGESFAARHTAYDLGPGGCLSNPRTWYRDPVDVLSGPAPEVLAAIPYAPDGCAIDENDDLWVADALHSRILHLSAHGDFVKEIKLPEEVNPYACAFGGDDGRRLLATCAPSFIEDERVTARESVLMVIDTPRSGLLRQ